MYPCPLELIKCTDLYFQWIQMVLRFQQELDSLHRLTTLTVWSAWMRLPTLFSTSVDISASVTPAVSSCGLEALIAPFAELPSKTLLELTRAHSIPMHRLLSHSYKTSYIYDTHYLYSWASGLQVLIPYLSLTLICAPWCAHLPVANCHIPKYLQIPYRITCIQQYEVNN